MFYFDEIGGKRILKSDLIENAQAFFTTKDICICDKGSDTNLNIKNNRKLIADYLKIEPKNFISPVQTHSANVDVVSQNKLNYPETDGLILTDNNYGIYLNFADCTPLIFYDEKQNIGAISHAGWRGTAKKIAVITAKKMINECGSKPENISVLIGPAICSKCYEVGEEVYKNFYKIDEQKEKYYIDLKKINRKQLADLGIKKIDVCPYCTCCDNEYFFSYRKENGTTMRHSAVFKLS